MKSTDELIKEFLEKGGEVEVIPYNEPIIKRTIGNLTKGPPNLLTLPEAEELFGVKQNRVQKKKEPNFDGIDLSLIPEHLHKFISKSANVEQVINNKGDNEDEAH